MAQKSIRPSPKEAIIDAAITLLASNGNSTLAEIALRAGVGRATLHRHFRSREDLITAIQLLCIAETDAAATAFDNQNDDALTRLHNMFKAVIPLGDKFHFLYSEYSSDENLKRRYQQELIWVKKLVDELKQQNYVASDVPTTWAVAQIDQLIWVAWNEVGKGNIAIKDVPMLAVRTFTRGLK